MNKVEPLANDRKFRSYYERHLKPLEEQFEKNRLAGRAERNKRAAAAIVPWLSMLVLAVWWFDSTVDFGWWLLPFAALFSGILLGLWAWLPMMLQYGHLKEEILPRLIPFFGDLKFTWDAELSMSQFSASHLIPRHNKVYVEDLVEGSHQGVPLRFAEISLKAETTHSRPGDTTTSSRRVEKVFKGLLVTDARPQLPWRDPGRQHRHVQASFCNQQQLGTSTWQIGRWLRISCHACGTAGNSN